MEKDTFIVFEDDNDSKIYGFLLGKKFNFSYNLESKLVFFCKKLKSLQQAHWKKFEVIEILVHLNDDLK